jgi:hypothetical protein
MILPPELIEEINKKDNTDQVLSFTVLGTTYVAMTLKRLNDLSGRKFFTSPANPEANAK